MSDTKRCDRCGADGAVRVEGSAAITGIARAGHTTGTAEAADACASCIPVVLAAVQTYTAELLVAQAPFHTKILDFDDQLAEAEDALASINKLIGVESTPERVAEQARLQAVVVELHAKRDQVLADANADQQTRLAAFRASVPNLAA